MSAYDCNVCGASVDREKPFSHRHCMSCDELYDDWAAHDAAPEFRRKHALRNVAWGAVDELNGWVVGQVRDRLFALGSRAEVASLAQEVGEKILSSVVEHVAMYEEEEAIRVISRRTPDVSTLADRLRSLREWIEADAPLGDGGWDHLGFWCDGVVVERPAGSLHLQACPEGRRVWVRLEQDDATKWVRSRRSGGLLNPITDAERSALRSAIEAAGLTVEKEWGGGEGVSYEVGGAPVGPNVAAGVRKGWGGLKSLRRPTGWEARSVL